MAANPESPLDLLWKEYSLIFREFDDLTLARWLAQTLGQLEGKAWRLSHPLLGAYRLAAELQGFKKYDQAGISLSAGQVAVVDVKLAIGAVTETVSVNADVPIVDPGKIEEGRTLTTAEIETLPLTSRNPYNFALLQPGVVGFETQEFGVPRLTANGALLRVNYQIDGNDNTEKDRAGLRQMPMSEVMIREVKVVTSGYAPEFGQTMGLVYNAITPSGSNRQQGQASHDRAAEYSDISQQLSETHHFLL